MTPGVSLAIIEIPLQLTITFRPTLLTLPRQLTTSK